METISDHNLMLKVKAGETRHLGALYERYKKRLFGFFYQLNGDQMLCEDMVQNTFMRLHKYSHTYRTDSNFASWMFQVARNVNNNHFRSNKAALYATSLDEAAPIEIDDVNAHQQLTQSETGRILHQALGKLSPENREFLVLSKMKAMRFKDVAEVMGCKEVTARSKVHRAMKELKSIYTQLEKR